MPATSGPIRACYFYEYMALPSRQAGAPSIDHMFDMANQGMNTALVKMLTETATPLQLQYWKLLQGQAATAGMTLYPVFNYQNSYYLANNADPVRRYFVTSGSSSMLHGANATAGVIGCPLDPKFIRASMTLGMQRIPGATAIGWDPEFPGGPGGFHSYVNPCYCPGCRVDYWRHLYGNDQPVPYDPNLIAIATAATAAYLAWEQAQHQSLVAEYAAQCQWTDVAMLDPDKDDHFIDYTIAGLRQAGKQVTVYSELTYQTGNTTGAQAIGFSSATDVGGLQLRYFNATQLTAAAASANLPVGFFLFTTFSFWGGQAYASTLTNPYDLADTIANYYAALESLNGTTGGDVQVATYSVTLDLTGNSGSVVWDVVDLPLIYDATSARYGSGGDASIIVYPEAGYSVLSWAIDGVDQSVDPSQIAVEFNPITGSHTITAVFG